MIGQFSKNPGKKQSLWFLTVPEMSRLRHSEIDNTYEIKTGIYYGRYPPSKARVTWLLATETSETETPHIKSWAEGTDKPKIKDSLDIRPE